MAMRKMPVYIYVFLAVTLLPLLLLTACSDRYELTMNTYPDPPTFEQLANLRYRTVFAKGGSVQLQNGNRRMRTAFGTNRIFATIRLAGYYATGDLDGDGTPDAAAVLVSSPGGVGTYLELQAVLNYPAGLQPAASAYLTELAEVRALKIEAGEIKITLQKGEGETIERRYRMEDSTLLEIPE
jgi:hypothetical protein